MGDPDRLAEIKVGLDDPGWYVPESPAGAVTTIGWLIGEVERFRGLLARLEWSGLRDLIDEVRCCPVCAGRPDEGHASDCWLAAELHP